MVLEKVLVGAVWLVNSESRTSLLTSGRKIIKVSGLLECNKAVIVIDVSNDETLSVLREILATLNRIETQLGKLTSASQASVSPQLGQSADDVVLDVMEILNTMDENILPTVKALLTNGGFGTAHQISELTNRSRARENQHLNHLVNQGYLSKRRRGRTVEFFISPDVWSVGEEE